MNLHLTIDQKFILSFIERQEEFSDSNNKYVLFTHQESVTKAFDALETVPMKAHSLAGILKQFEDVKTIYFHGLTAFFQELILEFQLWEKYTLTWIFYGGELFGSYRFYNNFLMSKSQEEHKKMYPEYYFKPSINPIQLRRNILNYKFYKKKLVEESARMEEAVKRIDYFAHYIYSDYKRYVLPINPNIKFIDWNYAINSDDKKVIRKTSTKTLILGNSASIYNNHADGLHVLKENLKENSVWNILTPLSYNDRRGYGESISSLGKALFGEKFQPLTAFLPKNEYEQLISSISAAVYFNLRSQAAGNVFWFIRQEIPVFLKKENTLFGFLKEIGIIPLSVEEDLPLFLKNERHISFELLKNNAENLAHFFSKERVGNAYQKLLSVDLKNDSN